MQFLPQNGEKFKWQTGKETSLLSSFAPHKLFAKGAYDTVVVNFFWSLNYSHRLFSC